MGSPHSGAYKTYRALQGCRTRAVDFPFLDTAMCGVIGYHSDDSKLASRAATALRAHRAAWVHHYVGSMGPVSTVLALCAAATGHLDGAAALCEESEADLVHSDSKGDRFHVSASTTPRSSCGEERPAI